MDVLAAAWLVARFLLLLAGLLVPGALLVRALRVPVTPATAFAGSTAALFATVLGLQFTGLPLTLTSLAAGLLLIALLAHLGRRGPIAPPTSLGPDPVLPLKNGLGPFTAMGSSTPLYLLVWAAILLRAWQNPLAGPDVEFRWGFLAEQVLRLGSLDFYPPRAAADFTRYFWVESIPPGASALHAWAFACAGSSSAAWTLPALLLQIVALHELIGRAAASLGGKSAARFAVLAAAACPLLTWSTLLGQETGLTALALAGIVFSLIGWRAQRTAGWAALLGLFALQGAMAREYGLVFPALAALGLLASRADRVSWQGFAAVAAVSVLWPLRTWYLTGNPFYSLAVGGLFPVNPLFVAWINDDAIALRAVLRQLEGWRDVTRYLVLFAPGALLGGAWLIVGTWRGSRLAAWGLAAVGSVGGLWLVSVPYTNGGLFYSMRVTAPALALSCVGTGLALAALAERRRFGTVGNGHEPASQPGLFGQAFSALLCLATLAPTLSLPQNPWRTPWNQWAAFTPATPEIGVDDPTVKAVQKLQADGGAGSVGVILADGPGFQRRFAPVGLTVVPPWSPQAESLFDLAAAPGDVARRWRASGITHVVITKWQVNLDYFRRRSRWERPPFRTRLVAETPQTWVYAVQAAE